MTDLAIRTKGLKKSYQTAEVLKGVDFDVQRGEVFALLGSNGAGKTTIIRILVTLLRPDGGTASVSDFDVSRAPEKVRQSISLSGQFTAVDEVLTGRENLRMIARLRHLDDPRGIVEKLLERFGLTDVADRKAGMYSGGMKRKLDLAMSLVGNPSVVFLDEPTTGLDPEARREVWEMIKELANIGTTVFLTTQYLEEAEKLADRVAILHGGRIIVDAALSELRKLLPPTQVEYVEAQPTLEEIFLHITGKEVSKKGGN